MTKNIQRRKILAVTKIGEKKGIRYKSYEQNQVMHLPVMLGELVKENVLVQIIDKLVEDLDLEKLNAYYSGIGCPAYHPQMMIKVWLYGYCNKVYTSRPLARKLREDLGFIYLSGKSRPCFKTLSDFRSRRMKGMIDQIFEKVLVYMVESGYVDLSDLYVDGSRWEANANKYKVVWRKNMERYRSAVQERVRDLLRVAKELQDQEDTEYGQSDLSVHQSEEKIVVQLTSEQLRGQIKQLNEVVEEQSKNKRHRKLKSIANKLTKEATSLEKYEEQEKTLAGRNSYSKTDTDAGFMYSKSQQLLPQYNPQITTNNQYVVNPTVHQTASDSAAFSTHLEQLEKRTDLMVDEAWSPDMTADAGYGSEENYALLEQKGMRAFVKYPLWYKEIKGQLAKQLYRRENWEYEEQGDYFTCPQGKRLNFIEEQTKNTKRGYERILRKYESESCLDCPVFKLCRGEKAGKDTNRTIQISRKLEVYKEQAKTLLASTEGKSKRSQRSVDVETPFGNMKYNMGHRRFVLRSLPKVSIEFTLLCLGHNLRKIECEKTGRWKAYYAQRAAKRTEKQKKRA